MKTSKFLTLTLLIASSSILGCPKTDPTPPLSQKDKIEKMKGLLKEIKTLRTITGQHVPVTFRVEEDPTVSTRAPIYLPSTNGEFVLSNTKKYKIHLFKTEDPPTVVPVDRIPVDIGLDELYIYKATDRDKRLDSTIRDGEANAPNQGEILGWVSNYISLEATRLAPGTRYTLYFWEYLIDGNHADGNITIRIQ
ncbi:hypothetical protein [Armatimonas sp.]|uniref:hypothetical protein n=1 Tax=Armatimonas sp. TaxID=1872638 RepID=UPI00374FF269